MIIIILLLIYSYIVWGKFSSLQGTLSSDGVFFAVIIYTFTAEPRVKTPQWSRTRYRNKISANSMAEYLPKIRYALDALGLSL